MADMSKTTSGGKLATPENSNEKFFQHSFHFDEEDIQTFGSGKAELDQELRFAGKVRVPSISSEKDDNGKRSRITVEFTEGEFSGDGNRLAEKIFGKDD